MDYKLRIAWLYPDLMSTYGDRGNVIVLKKRGEWRDIAAEIIPITLETQNAQLQNCDLVFMGGAQDRQQKIVAKDFLTDKALIVKEMIEQGIPGLFVCAAYQLIGRYYKPYQGNPIAGAGIFDLVTVHPGDQAKRLIGNVVANIINLVELKETTIVGFENHGGRTYLGPKLKPFARVKRGFGNNGKDRYEGAIYKNAIGSYFHGPVLPKNPQLADWLIQKALSRKYREEIKLKPLSNELENKACLFCLQQR